VSALDPATAVEYHGVIMTPEQLEAQLKPQTPGVEIFVKIQDGGFGLRVTNGGPAKSAPPDLVAREYLRVKALLEGEGLRSDAELAAQLLPAFDGETIAVEPATA
jgi:hypothetical protein